jgi:hypothetical protein
MAIRILRIQPPVRDVPRRRVPGGSRLRSVLFKLSKRLEPMQKKNDSENL